MNEFDELDSSLVATTKKILAVQSKYAISGDSGTGTDLESIIEILTDIQTELSSLKENQDSINNKLTGLETKVNDLKESSEYYKGDTVTLNSTFECPAVISSNSTSVMVTLFLDKTINSEVSSVTVTSGKIAARGPAGYIIGESNRDDEYDGLHYFYSFHEKRFENYFERV